MRKYLIALILLIAVVYFYGLGKLPLVGPDEPRYSEVAREMVVSGDWIDTKLAGKSWFEKPVLTYWLSATGFKLFGFSEFGARFGIALLAGLGSILTFLFGSRAVSPIYGYLSASVLTIGGMWIGFSRAATFDMPLTVSMSIALFAFYLWESNSNRADRPDKYKDVFWYVFCFGLGLGLLAKGLVGIILPVGIIVPYLFLTHRLKIIFNFKLIVLGSIIFFATAATWYWPIISRYGMEFINEFFYAHHFQRYTSNKFKHPQPFYFFFAIIIMGIFPWSLYLISGVAHTVKHWAITGWSLRSDKLGLFLMLWVLVPTVFFSISGSKLPGYILPVFPALALLVGRELYKWWDSEIPRRLNVLLVSTALMTGAVGIFFGLWAPNYFGIRTYNSFTVGVSVIVTSVLTIAIWYLLSGRAAVLFQPFGFALVIITTANLVFPALGNAESFKSVALAAVENAKPNERLVFYITSDNGINFYATDLPLRDAKSELLTTHDFEKAIADTNGHSILIVTARPWVSHVKRYQTLKVSELFEQKRNTECSPDCDWVLLRAEKAK